MALGTGQEVMRRRTMGTTMAMVAAGVRTMTAR
jgi:hypothetical protein